MPTFLLYSLKAAGCLAVFYLFYKLLLSRDTLHRMNRVLLCGVLLLSFLLPLCVITVEKELPGVSAAGIDVTGVDASPAMLDALGAKPGGDSVTTVLGDMADPPLGLGIARLTVARTMASGRIETLALNLP